MLFWQLSCIPTINWGYKKFWINIYVSLFSNQGDKVLKCKKTMWQINKNQVFAPWIREQQYIEILVWNFFKKPYICCNVGKLSEHIQCIVVPGDIIQNLVKCNETRISKCKIYIVSCLILLISWHSLQHFYSEIVKKFFISLIVKKSNFVMAK